MNVSQPIASRVGSVDFGFLTSEEIKALSVKKIQNSDTFDTLLQPSPGGLYDLALGAYGDSPCLTCHLNVYSCPGHVGHIELPCPVYHVTFMDQLLRLLRARCEHCSRLKLRRADINLFVCKLRLIQHGLLSQSQELENIQVKASGPSRSELDPLANESEGLVDSDHEMAPAQVMELRNRFVRRAIRKTGHQNAFDRDIRKVEAILEERRAVIKHFLANIVVPKECSSCGYISSAFRKDKYSKIFRRPPSQRDKAKNIQKGLRSTEPLLTVQRERNATPSKKHEDGVLNGTFVIDAEEVSTDEEEDWNLQEPIDGRKLEKNNSHDHGAPRTRRTVLKGGEKQMQKYVDAEEVRAALARLFEQEQEIMRLVYDPRASFGDSKPVSADIFFIQHLLVPPNRYRPEVRTGEGQVTEDQQNTLYKRVLMQCVMVNQIRKEIHDAEPTAVIRPRNYIDLQSAKIGLQDAVNSLIDSDRNPHMARGNQQTEEGIKQKLEKKEGLFRMNMMGKRVNFAARSVISPDPNIETNEIGVPPVFAKKLTYPEPVTNHNFYDLKEAVLNGVNRWPGAAAIENENGQIISLKTKNFEERQAMANQLLAPSCTSIMGTKNKKVHRHLNNGDIVLMNRQPTLHKPSIMGHRARILPGEKTIRMHYANCNTYNADFDGDEMNLHFPQNEIARAEALQIADTDHQYLVATSGKPLRGLIQDHISMGVSLTNRDTFFDREEYQQLLYSSLRPENNQTATDRIASIVPALIKPRPMWTGKQVVTTVLKNITPANHPGLSLIGRSQTSGDRWADKSEEGTVIFHSGDLLCGILDKAHLGPSGGGFVHAIYETYGPRIAGKLLSVMGRLLTKLLHMKAFSCGMEDIVFTRKGDQTRREMLREAQTIGFDIATKYVLLEDARSTDDPELHMRLQDILHDEEKHAGLDNVYNSRTSKLSGDVTSSCLPVGLRKDFPYNQMQAMTTSGAKGSVVNANLISCNLGQQVLEGRRVPVMVSGKTLPSFKPYETNIRAGGYITDRFLTGVMPQEYFFHAMAGREGLIDTAVKTSRSGYLQRCLIKGMEGLKVEYDTSVRDTDGSMVQFLYGEDGLDVTKQKYLTDFRFLAENYLALVAQFNVSAEYQKIFSNEASTYHKAALKRVKKTSRVDVMDPVLAIFNPGSAMGSTSESFASALKLYSHENPERLLKDKSTAPVAPISKKTFATLLDMKYMKSVVDPGEAVGIVAGQSIGEPSTQMTLNTFHLAGHSAKNVTLGIPRLREIVMTASDHISTPSTTLHLNPEVSEEEGRRFAKGITRLMLAEVVESVTVGEKIGEGVTYQRAKIYNVRLDLFPPADYCETYAITVADIARTIEYKFIPFLTKAIRKELSKKGDAQILKNKSSQPEIGVSSKALGELQRREMLDEDTMETAEDALTLERERDDEQEATEGGQEDEDEDDGAPNKQEQSRDVVSYEKVDEEEAGPLRTEDSEDEENRHVEHSGNPRGIRRDGANGLYDNSSSNEEEDDEDRRDNFTDLAKDRRNRIITKHNDIVCFSFDETDGTRCEIQLEYDVATVKLLMLNIVEAACRSAVIQLIPGIGTCVLGEEKVRDPISKKERAVPVVLTEGVNLNAMHNYQSILNPHMIFTNDIVAMLKLYGVEACRATIIREMDAVFKGHSISVDNRHLNLIADTMTRAGGFNAFSRTGMRSAVSPFAKMSFETTVNFLRDAVLDGDWDELAGPSARIVMGKVSKVGTGVFDVLLPIA